MIRLVTDSSSDLPEQLVSRHGIEVVPLTIRFGEEEFVDRHQLTPSGFWDRLGRSASLPETAAPSAGAFLDAYRRLAEQGAEGVVAVCLSSEISGTYQSAVIAAEQADLPVKVVDSRTVSMALGFQVLSGAAAADQGGDLAAVTEACLRATERTDLLAALDTLEFLQRGGRVGGAQAMVGGLLDIKPLIAFVGGVVAPAGRVRTRSKAVARLVERVSEVADSIDAVAVLHGGGSDLDAFTTAVTEAAAGLEPVVAEIGPVVGTHSGPGILGVAWRLR